MIRLLYLDTIASRNAYTSHIAEQTNGILDLGEGYDDCIYFNKSKDKEENRLAHRLAMDIINEGGVYGYTNDHEENPSMRINDLRYHEQGWKDLMLHLSSINCLVVRIADVSKEEADNKLLSMINRLLRDII